MRHALQALLLSAFLVSFGAIASAQSQYGPEGGPYQPDSVDNLVQRVHHDLNDAYSQWHLKDSDRDRLNHAQEQLREFAKDWRNGKFDKDDLDDSIASVQHVLDNNRLAGPVRDALSNDTHDMRRLREAYDHHEIGNWKGRH
jgi:hypothetical protein